MDKTASCLILVLLVALALLAAACEPTAPHIVTKVATPTPDAVVQKVVTATPKLTETRIGKRMTATPQLAVATSLAPGIYTSTTGATQAPQIITHVVQEGETLGLIAKKYGTSVETLVALNEIENPNLIRVGQELVVGVRVTETPKPTSVPEPTATPAFAGEEAEMKAYAQELLPLNVEWVSWFAELSVVFQEVSEAPWTVCTDHYDQWVSNREVASTYAETLEQIKPPDSVAHVHGNTVGILRLMAADFIGIRLGCDMKDLELAAHWMEALERDNEDWRKNYRSWVEWFSQHQLRPLKAVTATPNVSAPTSVPVPAYHIVEVKDVSVGRVVRFAVRVVTEFPISTEQCDAVCDDVVQGLKERGALSAAVVFVFDTRALPNYAYSLARCFYAPNGEWGDAIYVQAGDYSTHRFVNDYRPKGEDPEAAMAGRPTEQEYEMCVEWDALVSPASENLKTLEEVTELEDTAYKKVAEEHGVSVQRVKDVILKCIIWPSR